MDRWRDLFVAEYPLFLGAADGSAQVLDVVPDGHRLPLPDGSYIEVEAHERSGMTGIHLWAVEGQPPRTVTVAGTEYRVVVR